MVDVVDVAATVAELDQVLHRLGDVPLGQDLGGQVLVEVELVVELEATDRGQVVAVGPEEERLEQVLGRVQRRGVARAQSTVDLENRLFGRGQLVLQQGVAQEGADVEVVDEQDVELLDARLHETTDVLFADVLVGVEQDLAGVLVDDVVGGDLANEFLDVHGERLDARVAHALDVRTADLAALLDQHVAARGVLDVVRRTLPGEQVVVDRPRQGRHQNAVFVGLALGQDDGLFVVEVVEQLLGRVAERAQKHGGVELATAVDADVQQVFVVELEVEPRAAVRNDARGEELLARGVGLAAVMVEEDTG